MWLLERFDRTVGRWVVVETYDDVVDLIDAVQTIGRREAVLLRSQRITTQVTA